MFYVIFDMMADGSLWEKWLHLQKTLPRWFPDLLGKVIAKEQAFSRLSILSNKALIIINIYNAKINTENIVPCP